MARSGERWISMMKLFIQANWLVSGLGISYGTKPHKLETGDGDKRAGTNVNLLIIVKVKALGFSLSEEE